MKNKMRFFGSLFMTLAIVLGALSSHYFKRILSPVSLSSFEVGLRYLIYQGLGMLFLSGFEFPNSKTKKIVFRLILWGTVIFSGSIFILSFKNQIPFSISWLGPVTPLGGLTLFVAWTLTTLMFMNRE